MQKRLMFIFVVFIFLSFHNFALADVIINEIKYSPTSKQWVEIYNDTDSDIDITTYKILDSSVKTGHSILVLDGKSNLIFKHSFGIIAKVTDDFGSISTPVFKSSLNIKVSSDKVVLKNSAGEDVDSVDIDGSAVDGNSLQLINGSWIAATPTPGEANKISASSSENTSGNDEAISTASSAENTTETKTKTPPIKKIKTQITGPALSYVGIPFVLEGKTFGLQGEALFTGKYFWNFGDGDSREAQVTNNEKFSHTYFYPGEYAVTLEYYPNIFADVPDAVDKITIKAIVPEVSISSVGEEKDFFIELANNTAYDANVSNWFLASSQRTFLFPRNTVIGAKKKMIISPQISHFSIADKDTLKLMTPQNEMVFAYNTFVAKPAVKQSLTTVKDPIIPTAVILSTNQESSPTVNSEKTNDKLYSFPVIPLVSFVFIGGSAYAVYFIRRKKVIPSTGDDFQILDE